MKTALLIIDMQEALCFGEEAAFEAGRVIERINTVSRKAREAGMPVVLIQHEEEEGALQFDSGGSSTAAAGSWRAAWPVRKATCACANPRRTPSISRRCRRCWRNAV